MSLLYRSIIAFSLFLYIGLQSFTAAHAASHAHDHHEQDCVICEVMVVSDEAVALMPPPAQIAAPYIYERPHYAPPSIIENFQQAPACIPPPRAPPA